MMGRSASPRLLVCRTMDEPGRPAEDDGVVVETVRVCIARLDVHR